MTSTTTRHGFKAVLRSRIPAYVAGALERGEFSSASYSWEGELVGRLPWGEPGFPVWSEAADRAARRLIDRELRRRGWFIALTDCFGDDGHWAHGPVYGSRTQALAAGWDPRGCCEHPINARSFEYDKPPRRR